MEDNKSSVTKNKIVSGMMWLFGERISAQLVSTLVAIVLARLLLPEHYGMITIVTVFITFSNVFVTGGFSTALIQKKEADDLDFDSAFWLSMTTACLLYVVLFFASPIIAAFYEMPELIAVIRVMAIKLPLAALNSVQRAYLQRNMEFKRFFKVTMGGTLTSAALGIAAATAGLGTWALVIQQLSNVIMSSILLFRACEWNPKLRFSLERMKEIWKFGWKVLVTQLVINTQGDIRSLVVGKAFGAADLAYYGQGQKYPDLLMSTINAAINKVMLSAYSKEQDDIKRLLSMLRRSVSVCAFILIPVLMGFAAVAEPFVSLLLTDKWLGCVPFLQIFCIAFITRPLEACCQQALLAIGKSNTVLIATIAIGSTNLIGVFIAVFVFKSVLAIALFSLVATLISLSCYLLFANRYFDYKLKMQLQDFVPSLLFGIVMFVSVRLVGHLQMNVVLQLVLQIVVGVVVYVGCSVLAKLEPFRYTLGMLRKKR